MLETVVMEENMEWYVYISPFGTVHFILLHSHDVQYRLSV